MSQAQQAQLHAVVTNDAQSLDSIQGVDIGAILLGLVFVAVLPALFWMAVVNVSLDAFGLNISWAALLLFGSVVVTFLTLVYATLLRMTDY